MTGAAIAEALDEVEHQCPKCGERVTLLVRRATVAHVCPKGTTRALTTFVPVERAETTSARCDRPSCGGAVGWLVSTVDVKTEQVQTTIRLCTADATAALLLDRDDVMIRKP